jgi:hypothetical protein
MLPEDTAAAGSPLDVITLAIRELAAIEDPIHFDRQRKVVMAIHHLSAGTVDQAVQKERARMAAAAPLDDIAAQAEIVRISKLNPLAYARERDSLAHRLGISVGSLDALVRAERGEDEPGQGKPITLPEPQPWGEPVSGATLLADIAAEVKRYMVLAPGAAEVVALWTLHAHALDAFGISPRLAITSPRPGCGKTTLLDIIARLVPRPLVMANVSAAAVYRTVEVAHPTLLADEADTWLHDNDALRGILNAGHRRGGDVVRVVGDELEPRQFSTWCACCIAMIGKLPGTLADRSVAVVLQRKRPDEAVERFRFDRTEALDVLAQKAARWVADNLARLRGLDPAMPEGLSNRAADNWRPLLAIADAAGDDWPRRAREIAAETVDVDQGKRTGLLADIRDVFMAKGVDALSSQELCEALVAMEGHEWAEYRDGKPLTKNTLARLLGRDGISPGTIRTRNGTPKGYKLSQFEDAFARYLQNPPNQSATTPQPAENLGFPGFGNPQQPKGCGVSKNGKKPQFSAGCGVVADESTPHPPPEGKIEERGPLDSFDDDAFGWQDDA